MFKITQLTDLILCMIVDLSKSRVGATTKSVSALLDMGMTSVLISYYIAKELELSITPTSHIKLQNASGTEMAMEGTTMIWIDLPNEQFQNKSSFKKKHI